MRTALLTICVSITAAATINFDYKTILDEAISGLRNSSRRRHVPQEPIQNEIF